MKLLTESEFHATFASPMQRVALDSAPPVSFWPYFDAIPSDHFAGRVSLEGSVRYAWIDATGHFQHVLIDTDDSPAPNHALQRTEAGVGVFSVYHVFPRQPLSLSLGPLGDYALFPC